MKPIKTYWYYSDTQCDRIKSINKNGWEFGYKYAPNGKVYTQVSHNPHPFPDAIVVFEAYCSPLEFAPTTPDIFKIIE